MAPAYSLKYPIGVQTFSEIIEEDYIYVDKTELVYRLVTENKYVFLSRPRRFGKSLLLSTIEAYFRGRHELFKGLAIEKLESEWEQYPVFRIDLTGRIYDTPEDVSRGLSITIEEWETEYGLKRGEADVNDRFYRLIRQAAVRTGRKVVVLIDEYDKPIIDVLENGEMQERIRKRLQGFYSVIKKADEYIRFAMLSGVGKFAHLSIFSGLNNLKDISLDRRYATICGITESEMHEYFGASVERFSHVASMPEEDVWRSFKLRYDGYHFCEDCEDIYNPFSVLNAFDSCRVDDYWFRSGTPSFLVKLVRRNNFELGSVDDATATASQLSNITDSGINVVPLLYQAGYLTIKGTDKETGEYHLGFPNEEVSRGFWESFIQSYFPNASGNGTFSINAIIRDINSGRAEDFMVRLQSLISDTPSDTERNKEIHFQNVMAIVGKMLGYRVRTEVHSGLGRCDMILETPRYIYIFEFKLDRSPKEALQQIVEKGYVLPFMADPRTKILIGADFSTELRTLSGWKIERIQ